MGVGGCLKDNLPQMKLDVFSSTRHEVSKKRKKISLSKIGI